MSYSIIPRTPIPKFKAREIKTAELCSRALWYGIDFETGKPKTSDSEFIEIFAGPMYAHSPNARRFKPVVFQKDVHKLIKAGRLIAIYRAIKLMDFNKGMRAIHNQIYTIFFNARRTPTTAHKLTDGINAIEILSKAIVKNINHNQLVLASRILFYLCPNLTISNMNNRVAKSFGLQSRPHHHHVEFQHLFKSGLVTNQTNLNKCKLPMRHGKMNEKLWHEVNSTDWYQRRVLDIAVLLSLNLATPATRLKNQVNEFEKNLLDEIKKKILLAAKKKARSKGASAVRALK
jgi:hypothetical protein